MWQVSGIPSQRVRAGFLQALPQVLPRMTMSRGIMARMKNLSVLSLLLFLLLSMSASAEAATAKSQKLKLAVNVRYYYGHWRWGDFKMTPRAGIAGPDLRLEMIDGRLAVTSAYFSGSFSASGAISLADNRFHSRKNFDLSDNREAFEFGLEFRLQENVGLVLIYQLTQYDLEAEIELHSDQRLYGSGLETAINETRGLGLGLRPRLKLRRNISLSGEFLYFPRLTAKAAGSYQYRMLYRGGDLDERWFGDTHANGFNTRGELTYSLANVPVSLSLGYFYQRLDESESSPPGWLDQYLAGQSGSQSWHRDRFQGFTARAGFIF